VLAAYGFFLFLTNPRVTVFEDEAKYIAAAHRSAGEILASFTAGGRGDFAHPPLPDLLLHGWLRSTGGALPLLRVPSIVLYCLALWLLAETAYLRWDRRWTAVWLGVAWPAGFLLGRPAGWYALAALALAAMHWSSVRWRLTRDNWALAALTLSAALLVHTSYFGWVFVAATGIELAAGGAERRHRLQLAAAAALVAAAFAPLVPAVLGRAPTEIRGYGNPASLLARTLYLAYSLLPGELAAPWTWPGVVAALAGLALVWLSLRTPESRRALLAVAAPFAIAAAAGLLAGARLILFVPGALLFLASTIAHARARLPALLAGVTFAMGWLGILTRAYPATHRYTEPWPRVAAEVVSRSRPGDVILASHPSFYFYLGEMFPSDVSRRMAHVPAPHRTAGRTFAPIHLWREAVDAPSDQIVYVRSTLMPLEGRSETNFLAYAEGNLRLVSRSRFARDPGAALKRRFFPDTFQPEWRIEIQVWSSEPRTVR